MMVQAARPQRLHLLIVDDDDVDRERVRRMLRGSPIAFTVVEASSGAQAIELASREAFDCILLDYRLGDTLATELLSDLQAHSQRACPIIMITGQGGERSVVEAMRKGVYDYLPKGDLVRDQLLGAIEGSVRWFELQGQLRESEARLRQVAEALPQLIWTCRADGSCESFGPQWVAYTGIPEAEQLADCWTAQLHPDDFAATTATWQRALATSKSFNCEVRLRRHDGQYRWFDLQAVALVDAQGKVTKWFGSNTDITRAQAGRAAARRERAAFPARAVRHR